VADAATSASHKNTFGSDRFGRLHQFRHRVARRTHQSFKS
jgi:hypothetical protein